MALIDFNKREIKELLKAVKNTYVPPGDDVIGKLLAALEGDEAAGGGGSSGLMPLDFSDIREAVLGVKYDAENKELSIPIFQPIDLFNETSRYLTGQYISEINATWFRPFDVVIHRHYTWLMASYTYSSVYTLEYDDFLAGMLYSYSEGIPFLSPSEPTESYSFMRYNTQFYVRAARTSVSGTRNLLYSYTRNRDILYPTGFAAAIHDSTAPHKGPFFRYGMVGVLLDETTGDIVTEPRIQAHYDFNGDRITTDFTMDFTNFLSNPIIDRSLRSPNHYLAAFNYDADFNYLKTRVIYGGGEVLVYKDVMFHLTDGLITFEGEGAATMIGDWDFGEITFLSTSYHSGLGKQILIIVDRKYNRIVVADAMTFEPITKIAIYNHPEEVEKNWYPEKVRYGYSETLGHVYSFVDSKNKKMFVVTEDMLRNRSHAVLNIALPSRAKIMELVFDTNDRDSFDAFMSLDGGATWFNVDDLLSYPVETDSFLLKIVSQPILDTAVKPINTIVIRGIAARIAY